MARGQRNRFGLNHPRQVTPSRTTQGFDSLIICTVRSSMIRSTRRSTRNRPSQYGSISTSNHKPRFLPCVESVRSISDFERTCTWSPGRKSRRSLGVSPESRGRKRGKLPPARSAWRLLNRATAITHRNSRRRTLRDQRSRGYGRGSSGLIGVVARNNPSPDSGTAPGRRSDAQRRHEYSEAGFAGPVQGRRTPGEERRPGRR
jgi:hypothetical protein